MDVTAQTNGHPTPAVSLPTVVVTSGRYTFLVPIESAHHEAILRVAMGDPMHDVWRGFPPSRETFGQLFGQDKYLQLAIHARDNGAFLGYVYASGYNPLHGRMLIGIELLPDAIGKVWPLEGLALFVDFLFEKLQWLETLWGQMNEERVRHMPEQFIDRVLTVPRYFRTGRPPPNDWAGLVYLRLTRDRFYREVKPMWEKVWGDKPIVPAPQVTVPAPV